MATLTVSAAGVNKAYDGTTTATVTLSDNRVSGDAVTDSYTSASFADPNAGTGKTVSVSGISISGTDAGNYTLANTTATTTANITAVPIQLSGTRTYDGTPLAAAGILTVANNLDDGNLTLSGTATLANNDVGSEAITPGTVARVQSAAGSVGSSAATSFTVTVATPANSNTLIAVISTRGTSTGRVSSVTQTGATWTRASQAANTNGTTTEIWYAPGVSGAGTTVTITLASSLFASAVVAEYSGVLTVGPLDQTANSTGSSTAAATGTTPTTTETGELWIGGIGLVSSSYTLGTPSNSFTAFTNSASTSGTSGNNARVYALEKIVTTTGTAASGGTVSTSSQWSGAIATFYAPASSLALGGSAAGNYTLTGLSGSVTITPKALTVTGVTANNKVYNGNTTATLTGTAALPASEAPGAGSSADGTPYTGDTVTLGGTATAVFPDKNVGTGKTVTVSGYTLGGAQAGNYTLTQPTFSANITQTNITVTAATNTKPYDGTTTAAAVPTVTSGSIQTGDTATWSEAYTTDTAGTGKTLVPSGSVNDGNGGANYNVTFANNTTGVINARALTVTGVSASNKIYDKTTTATVSTNGASLVGVLSPDVVTLGGTPAGTFASAGVANGVTVTVSGLTLGGADAGNYTLTQPTATANITAKALTMSGLSVPASKVYNGTTAAAVSGSPGALQAAEAAGSGTTNDGKPYTGDTVSLTGTATGTYDSKDVASATTVTYGGVSLTGAQAANYALAIQSPVSATITAKALTATGTLSVPASKVYDGTTSAAVTGSAALQATEAAGAGTTADGKPYSVDSVSLTGTATYAYNSKDVATATTVTRERLVADGNRQRRLHAHGSKLWQHDHGQGADGLGNAGIPGEQDLRRDDARDAQLRRGGLAGNRGGGHRHDCGWHTLQRGLGEPDRDSQLQLQHQGCRHGHDHHRERLVADGNRQRRLHAHGPKFQRQNDHGQGADGGGHAGVPSEQGL